MKCHSFSLFSDVVCQTEKSWKHDAFNDPVLIKEIETATGLVFLLILKSLSVLS